MEEVARGVEQRPLVQHVEVVAPRAVVPEAVAQGQRVPGEVARHLGAAVYFV